VDPTQRAFARIVAASFAAAPTPVRLPAVLPARRDPV